MNTGRQPELIKHQWDSEYISGDSISSYEDLYEADNKY